MAMPDFALATVDGNTFSASQMDAKAIVVMFICAHCPYVLAVEDRFIALRQHFEKEAVQFVGICANDPTDYPADAPKALHERATEKGYGFPYLIDDTQEVAKAFNAVCTPEFYVFDAQRQLTYHGQLDDNWKEPEAVTEAPLKTAIQAVLDDQPPLNNQRPSMGCSIKWRN